MLGPLLVLSGTFFEEVSTSVAKKAVSKKQEGVYTMGFINLFWGTLIFLAIILFQQQNLSFVLPAWKTFLLRSVLEVAQVWFSVKGVTLSDRSTFGFVRTGTIPLLLLVDLWLGYNVSSWQIAGIILLCIALVLAYFNHGLSKKGLGYTVLCTINAVITTSLYKYNISHGNSVASEQFLIRIAPLVLFFLLAIWVGKERPWRALRKPTLIWQSLTIGIGGTLESFAILFAPASLIMALKRSFSVLWSTLAGATYFHERHIAIKIITLLALLIGMGMLFA